MSDNAAPEFKRILLPFDDFTIKSEGAEAGSFEGYGAAYGNRDQGGDIIAKGTFADDLAEHEKSGAVPHMFWNHNQNEPIGDYTKMTDSAKGLKVSGKLWIGKGIPKAEQAYLMMKGNGPKGLSVGIMIPPGGRSAYDDKNTSTISKAACKEISVVPYPMNQKALVTSIKAALEGKDFITVREAEEVLRDVALWNDREAKTFLARVKKGFDVERDADARVLATKSATDALLASLHNLAKAL